MFQRTSRVALDEANHLLAVQLDMVERTETYLPDSCHEDDSSNGLFMPSY
jgi:hypothetical protein